MAMKVATTPSLSFVRKAIVTATAPEVGIPDQTTPIGWLLGWGCQSVPFDSTSETHVTIA
jgi:hypothetical protein